MHSTVWEDFRTHEKSLGWQRRHAEHVQELENSDASDDEESNLGDTDRFMQGDEEAFEDDVESHEMREHANQVKKNPGAKYASVSVPIPVVQEVASHKYWSEEASYDDVTMVKQQEGRVYIP
jgi:hypothetical protein